MKFGLLGRRLSHSYSPQIHAMLGDYEYPLYEKEPEEIEAFMKSDEFDGMNVTIPYKETVIPFMAQLSESAKKIGSVNTVTRLPDGSLYGDNTDYYGFSFLLRKAGFDVRDRKVLVLGSGGASKTAVCVCRDMGAESVTVISRSGKDNYSNISVHSDADYIINATPVGMYPENGVSPVELKMFPCCLGVADMIYNPSKTALLMQAQTLGIPYINGLVMLCAQAVKAAESFTKAEISENKIPGILSALEKDMLNIVLVGMPGCGKSTAGRLLAQKLGRQFIDTDTLIEQTEGRPIPDIFKSSGEEYFRDCESRAVARAGKLSGSVIATGGGAVLRDENKLALQQNSRVVFLTRELDNLATDGRPLSRNGQLSRMYEARLPHYRQVSDIQVQVCPDPEKTVESIMKGLELK